MDNDCTCTEIVMIRRSPPTTIRGKMPQVGKLQRARTPRTRNKPRHATSAVRCGLWQYARRGTLDRRFVILLTAGAIPLTYVGATAATYMSAALLRRGFALFLVLLASYSAWSVMRPPPLSEGSPIARLHPGFYSVVGAIGGFGSGFFGVGGASFAIPALTLLFGLPQVRAQALGLALVFPAIVIAIPTYAHAGAVDWQSGLCLGLGGVLSVPVGVGLAHRLPERTLRRAFCGLLDLGALLLWETA